MIFARLVLADASLPQPAGDEDWALPVLQMQSGDGPLFVLYEDGRVLFSGKWTEPIFLVQLTRAEMQKLLHELPLGALGKLNDFYKASDGFDMPTTEIVSWDRKRKKKAVGVYGDLTHRPTFLPARDRTPGAFLAIYDRMVAFQDPRARVWMPMPQAHRYPVRLPHDAEWRISW